MLATKSTKIVHMTSVHSALDHRIFVKECRSLAQAGYDVTIIGPYKEDTVADSVTIKSIVAHQSRFARMTQTAWSMYREACRQEADIYHFHDPELIPVGLLLRARGKRVIYDVHEDFPKDLISKTYLPAWSRKALGRILRRFENAASKQFSAVVTVTPSIADRFQEANRRTVIVHNYPSHDEMFKNPSPPDWVSRPQSVAYVGGVTVQRGIWQMVRAMALLPESLGAHLEIAGNEVPEDVGRESLFKHPGWKRVTHNGVLDRPGVFRLLKGVRAGLTVLNPEPNFVTAIPVKFFEYMGAGLPLISSDFPSWRKIVEDAQCGIMVDPMNPQAIADAIEYILTHPKEAEEMGRRGQQVALNSYSWDTQAAELLDLYAGLVKA